MTRIPRLRASTLVILTASLGCSSSNERVAEIAIQGAREQVQQNHRMAQLQREVAVGAKQLVESDAAARQQLIALETKREVELAMIAAKRNELHAERRELESKRLHDPIVADAIMHVGTLLACLLPLVLCGLLLRPGNQAQDDSLVVELLISELATDPPKLLPRPTQAPLLTVDDHAAK